MWSATYYTAHHANIPTASGGLIADAIGPANAVYPMTILSGLFCLATWAMTSSVPVMVFFVLLYGLCSGVFIAVLPVAVAQITPSSNFGGRIGSFYSVCHRAIDREPDWRSADKDRERGNE